MKHAARIALLAMLLVALPMRGYAGMLSALCESHHGGAAAAGEQIQKHGDRHPGDSHHHDADADAGDESEGSLHAASVCSVCAVCCASAGLASDANIGLAFPSPDFSRIPFFGRQVSAFVPDHLDRPPLSL